MYESKTQKIEGDDSLGFADGKGIVKSEALNIEYHNYIIRFDGIDLKNNKLKWLLAFLM